MVKHTLRPHGQTRMRRAAQYLAARPILTKWKRDRQQGIMPKVSDCKKLHFRYVTYMKYLWKLDKKPHVLHAYQMAMAEYQTIYADIEAERR